MKREQYAYQNTARMEKILNTSAKNGLSEQEAAERLHRNGPNRMTPKRPSPVLLFLRTVVCNGSLPLYLLALCLATPFLGRAVLFPSILYLAFLVFYLLLHIVRERELRAHELAVLPRVRVIRDGKTRLISPEELVIGDLLVLSRGDILFAHAHVTTPAEMEVFCVRDEENRCCLKHGGDCFDESAEPFNRLCPGDVIRSGSGCAFVTDKGTKEGALSVSDGDTVKNHGNMCATTTRITFVLSCLLFAFGFFRTCFTADYAFLGECLLLCAVLIATAGTSFYSVLFDLLFLRKNRRLSEKNGVMFMSVADMEDMSGVDAFVLSTRSMFLSARYVVRYFETPGGKRVTEKTGGTAELAVIADALYALRERCTLSMKEEAALGFCARYASAQRGVELYAKAEDDRCTQTSYRSRTDGRSFSLVWGDAEHLIPGLLYVTEDGKTRLLDAKQRDAMLDGAANLKKEGYQLYLFAETQTRNARSGMPSFFEDLRLLGFFALRKCSDEGAVRTINEMRAAGQKAFFVHDGESAEWLAREVGAFENVPVLDGTRDVFREELAHFVADSTLPFCIGFRLSPLQKAQVVTALTASGRRVAAAGTSFEDHRMMCAASVAIAPLREDAEDVCHLVQRTACVRAKEHVTTQVDTVRRSARLLSVFGLFTAALSASLIARTVIVLLGAIFGNTFLSCGWYTLLGVFLDVLAVFCFARTEGERPYEGIDGLIRENEKNFSLFAGILGGAAVTAVLAAFVPAVASVSSSFVFLTLILLLNVGLWYFSLCARSSGLLLYSVASVAVAAVPFIIGWLTDGRLGFLFHAVTFFWALLPVVALLLIGKMFEIYFDHKYTFKVGEKNE